MNKDFASFETFYAEKDVWLDSRKTENLQPLNILSFIILAAKVGKDTWTINGSNGSYNR